MPKALERLRSEGWLKAGQQFDEGSESELMYSLTAVGEQRLKEELNHCGSMISEFIEHGELDKSFQKFLDRGRSPGSN